LYQRAVASLSVKANKQNRHVVFIFKGMPVLLIRFHTPEETVGKSCKEKLQHLPISAPLAPLRQGASHRRME